MISYNRSVDRTTSFLLACFIALIGMLALPEFGIAQTPAWKFLKTAGSTAYDTPGAMAVDAAGNVYTVGHFSASITFDPSTTLPGTSGSYLIKCDPNGTTLWIEKISSTGGIRISSVVVSPAGDVYIGGDFSGTASFNSGAQSATAGSNRDAVLAKYNTSGTIQWIEKIENAFYTYTTQMLYDSHNRIIIMGYFYWGPSEPYPFIYKYDAAGTYKHSISYPVSVHAYTQGISTGPANNFYIAGITMYGYQLYQLVIQKTDSTGTELWHRTGTAGGNVRVTDIERDVSGNLYVTGDAWNSVTFDPGGTNHTVLPDGRFLAKFDPSGYLIWVINTDITEIAIDSKGRITGIGRASSGAITIVHMNLDGTPLKTYVFGAGATATETDLVIDNSDNVFVTGTYTGTVTFGVDDNGTIIKTNKGDADIFIGKLKAEMPNISGVVFFYPSHTMMSEVSIAATGLSSNLTDAIGYYTFPVPYGWSGTVTLTCQGYTFGNSPQTYTNVISDMGAQDYWVIGPAEVHISGRVTDSGGSGIAGVTLNFSNNGSSVVTDGTGNYDCTLAYKWDGTATPVNSGHWFSPSQRTYPALCSYQYNQDFTMTATAVEYVTDSTPTEYALRNGYPNPFNPSTTFSYELPKHGHVLINMLDVNGRIVKTLVDQEQSSGRYRIQWLADDESGRNIASGMYFCRMIAGEEVFQSKVIYVK